MPPANNSALVEIYEDRIQRLEDGVGNCRVEIGIVQTQVADGVKMLSEKLDVVAHLEGRVSKLEARRELDEELRKRDEEALAKKRERRSRHFKYAATIGSGLAALIGLVLKIVLGS